MNATTNDHSHKVVSNEEWLEARKAFLAKEKAFTRQRDELSRERRELPWVKVDTNYVFHGPNGKETLADLFDGRSQLIIYHFMFGPEWEQGCPSCSFEADHFNSFIVHLNARDVSMAAIARAPIGKIQAFKKRMGWSFRWVSSYQTSFNTDYRVSFTKDEMASGRMDYNFGINRFPSDEAPGVSVFYKDPTGDIFHTYSVYSRGLDILLGAYNFLDLTPMGRDEASLPWPMAWVRHHDRYENGPLVALSPAGSARISEEALP